MNRLTALDAASRLERLGLSIRDLRTDDFVIEQYLAAKRLSAAYVEELLLSRYPTAVEEFRSVTATLEREMRLRFGGYLHSSTLTIRGFTKPVPHLLAMLREGVGTPVSSARLRALTRDATHTERRTRALRQLGFDVQYVKLGDDDSYMLSAVDPDIELGAYRQARHIISTSRSLGGQDRHKLLEDLSLVEER